MSSSEELARRGCGYSQLVDGSGSILHLHVKRKKVERLLNFYVFSNSYFNIKNFLTGKSGPLLRV